MSAAVALSFEYSETSLPASYLTMSQLPLFDMCNGYTTCSVQSQDMLRHAPNAWYRCNATGGPTSDEFNQGRVIWASFSDVPTGFTGERLHVMLEGEIEYQSPIDRLFEGPGPVVHSNWDSKSVPVRAEVLIDDGVIVGVAPLQESQGVAVYTGPQLSAASRAKFMGAAQTRA